MSVKTKQLGHAVARALADSNATAVVNMHPKYKIAELLRGKFGEFGFKDGIAKLAAHCQLKKPYTVREWMGIEAGSEKEINHLVLFAVIAFFDVHSEEELYTDAHKKLLKTA